MRLMSGVAAILFSVLSLVFAGSPATTQPAFTPIGNEYLHNAYRVSGKVISGAQPEEEAAFAVLQSLGVRTIISVDGAKPNAEMAWNYGMEYIHLPISYDTVPVEQGEAIAKAILEKEGLIYIHCHHGKHRSAAAVAVACVMTGDIQPEQAESVLKTFGTDVNYHGLWQSARDARRLDDAEIHAFNVEFVEAAVIPPLAEAMVHVDETFEHLKAADAAGWKNIPGHPDIDPPHEALMLREKFHELNRAEEMNDRPEEFRKLMQASEDKSQKLEKLLNTWKAAGHPEPVPADIKTAFKAVGDACKTCHKDWRD